MRYLTVKDFKSIADVIYYLEEEYSITDVFIDVAEMCRAGMNIEDALNDILQDLGPELESECLTDRERNRGGLV